jgi:hypothetical protein
MTTYPSIYHDDFFRVNLNNLMFYTEHAGEEKFMLHSLLWLWSYLRSSLCPYYVDAKRGAAYKVSHSWQDLRLKVHKNEHFLAPIFKFVVFHCKLCLNIKILGKHFFDQSIMGGATIVPHSLKTKRNKKKFQDRPKIFFIFSKSYMTLLYLLIIDFPKFAPLTLP